MTTFSKEQFARAFDEGLRRDQQESWQKQTAEAYFLWLSWNHLRMDDILGHLQSGLLSGGGVGPETLVLKLKPATVDSSDSAKAETSVDFLVLARNESSPWLLSAMKGEEITSIADDSSLLRLLDRTKALEVGSLGRVAVTRQIFTSVLPVSPEAPFYFDRETIDISLLFFHLFRSGLYLNGERVLGFEQAMTLGSQNVEGMLVSFLSESLRKTDNLTSR